MLSERRVQYHKQSASSSKMMSYINETNQGKINMEKGKGKGVRYIYTSHPKTTIIPRWMANSKVEQEMREGRE